MSKDAAAPADTLDIQRQYYRLFHPVIRRQARAWCIRKFEAPFATICRSGNTTESPGGTRAFALSTMGNSEVAVTRYIRVVTDQLLKVLIILVGTSSRSAHPTKERQCYSRGVYRRLETAGRRSTLRETRPKESWRPRRSALRKEQLENSNPIPNPRRMMAVLRRERKQKRRGQRDVEIYFTKAITNTLSSPRSSNIYAPLRLFGKSGLTGEAM
jgi:hypothetical protein